MYIKVKYGKEVVTYTDKELSELSKQQLKQLKADLQNNIEEISAKKSKYINENTEERNSSAYWRKINSYKSATVFCRKAISYVNTFVADAQDDNKSNTEHWLWCYYQESKKLLTTDCIDNIESMADEKAGFHCAFGGF